MRSRANRRNMVRMQRSFRPRIRFSCPKGTQAIAEQSSARDAEPHSVPVPSPSPAADVDERVPTSHPPNREALADIPFLVPPPGFRPDAAPESAAPSDTVDAVVQKVLEKLRAAASRVAFAGRSQTAGGKPPPRGIGQEGTVALLTRPLPKSWAAIRTVALPYFSMT